MASALCEQRTDRYDIRSQSGTIRAVRTDLLHAPSAEDGTVLMERSSPAASVPLGRDDFYRQAQVYLAEAGEENLVFGLIDIDGFSSFAHLPCCTVDEASLGRLSDVFYHVVSSGGLFARLQAKTFIFYAPFEGFDAGNLCEAMRRALPEEAASVLRMGLYKADSTAFTVESIVARTGLLVHLLRKKNGPLWGWYSGEFLDDPRVRESVSSSLSAALDDQQFFIRLQPVFECSAPNRLVSAEALVRWDHPRYGEISPLYFLPLLEEAGLAGILDRAVFEQVCRFQSDLLSSGRCVYPISVNLSRGDFLADPAFSDKILEISRRFGLDGRTVMFEITERMFFGKGISLPTLRSISSQVAHLHDEGFKILIDDYGSGFSNIKTLAFIPFDTLKVDKFFIDNSQNPLILNILLHLIGFAKDSGITVVAEGVETQEQLELLDSMGCHHIQVYLFARPLLPDDFLELVEKSAQCRPQDGLAAG